MDKHIIPRVAFNIFRLPGVLSAGRSGRRTVRSVLFPPIDMFGTVLINAILTNVLGPCHQANSFIEAMSMVDMTLETEHELAFRERLSKRLMPSFH